MQEMEEWQQEPNNRPGGLAIHKQTTVPMSKKPNLPKLQWSKTYNRW